jgi:hypothetical protein
MEVIMFWSLSLQLMPDESVLEDSTRRESDGLKPAYSVFLTNKRAIFRFDGLGSTMAQSFLYHEIIEARPSQRMFITYLGLRTATKEYFLHIPEPEFWAPKILEYKMITSPAAAGVPTSPDPIVRRKKQDLIDMLDSLKRHAILTREEFDQKKKLVETLKI